MKEISLKAKRKNFDGNSDAPDNRSNWKYLDQVLV